MSNISTSKIVLSALTRSQDFSSKVFPYLKDEYFSPSDRIVYGLINNFITKYASLPTREAILIDLDNKQNINRSIHAECVESIEEIFTYELKDTQWLIDTAEKYCKDMALNLAIIEAADIAGKIGSGKGEGLSETAIPDLLTKAVSVSFDTRIGLDYLEDPEERFNRYNIVEDKIPFDLEMFNTITNGGFSKGTENIFLAGTAGGKSLTMCSFASGNLLSGKNVLYVTLEIDDLNVSKRIDANLMDVNVNNIISLSSSSYVNNINLLKSKTLGKLIIHEDLSGNFNSIRLKALLENMKLKKGFVPEVIYIDYLTLCTSSTYKQGTTTSYIYYKGVAEEMRLVAKQYNVVLVTCVQLNRSSYEDSDAALTGISESWGIASTADFIAVIIQTEELKTLNQYEIKQLKSRYSDLSENRRFCVGVDKTKMRLYELDNYSSYNSPTISSSTENDFIVKNTDENAILDGIKAKFGFTKAIF